jgi:hypothetical protein
MMTAIRKAAVLGSQPVPIVMKLSKRIIQEHLLAQQRALEFGAGGGNFTRTIPDRELVVGLDVAAAADGRPGNHSGSRNRRQ